MEGYQVRGAVMLLAGVILWSTAEVGARAIVGLVTPLQLVAARFTLGAVVLGAALPWSLRQRGLKLDRRVAGRAAGIALVSLYPGSLSFQHSLQYAGASVVATVFAVTPLVVYLLAGPVLHEARSAKKLLGVLIGVAGIAVLSLTPESADFTLLGLGLACVCPVGFAVFTVLLKRYAGPYAGLPMVALCFIFAALYMIPLAWVENETATLENFGKLWLPVLYLGAGTTGGAYLLYFSGLGRIEATKASSALFLKPPMAVALAALALGEPITWRLAACLVLVLTGLYLVTRTPAAASEAQESAAQV